MTRNRQLKADALCSFTADGIEPCEECEGYLPVGAMLWFVADGGWSSTGIYVGVCCVDRFFVDGWRVRDGDAWDE